MGIAPEEFVKVCQSDGAVALNEFVFNQILAVDDFLSFKKMMLKRNLELNVQAMAMMKVCHARPQRQPLPLVFALPVAADKACPGLQMEGDQYTVEKPSMELLKGQHAAMASRLSRDSDVPPPRRTGVVQRNYLKPS
jgi:hypothetical protein